MLLVALVLVVLTMRQLRQPETAARIERFFRAPSNPAVEPDTAIAAAPRTSIQPQAPIDHSAPATAPERRQFQKLLALAGWDKARFDAFDRTAQLTDGQRNDALDLLRRLRTFNAATLREWSGPLPAWNRLTADASEYRGRLYRLSGRAISAERRELPAKLATRLEMKAYFECDLALDGGGQAKVITARIAEAWLQMDRLDTPATARGLFLTLQPTEDGQPVGVFVSPEVGWHPREVRQPQVSFGKSILGRLGMDVGLLDVIEQRQPLLASEREAFYQLLAAAGRAGPRQLDQFAMFNLADVKRRWSSKAERLSERVSHQPAQVDQDDRRRWLLAQEVQHRAAAGRYSVAPLFNEPTDQAGELLVLDGVARRAVRVEIETARDDAPSDVARRFGFDHYWEIDLFTDDSQNNPIVFCVRELPPGFPTGDSIGEPVRLAGFFLKSWSFANRHAENGNRSDPSTRQFAPLLIGRGPLWIQSAPAESSTRTGLILGVLFVLLVAALWAVAWWTSRARKASGGRIVDDRFSLPDGQSLDEGLHLPGVSNVNDGPAAPQTDAEAEPKRDRS